MRRCLSVLPVLCLLSVVAGGLADAAPARRKVIILGFDGVDAGLFEKFMQEGRLPNLQKLRDRGTFLPLETTNPAQSPVAWAALTTGSWPGKTNIYDFLEVIRKPGLPPYPDLTGMVRPSRQRTLQNENIRHLLTSRAVAVLVGALVLCLLLKVFHVRWRYAVAIPGTLLVLVLAVGYVLVNRFLPEYVPMAINQRRGTPVWTVTARQGIRTTVVEAPCTFPPDKVDGAKILSGLGVPDIGATWGFWSFFTSQTDANTASETGGWIYPLRPKGNVATAFLHGPEDIYTKDLVARLVEQYATAKTRKEQIPIDRKLDDLLSQRIDPMIEMIRSTDLAEKFKDDEIQQLTAVRNTVMQQSTADGVRDRKFAEMFEPIRFEIDPAAKTLTATVPDGSVQAKLGEWSDWLVVTYRMNPLLKLTGMVKLLLQKIEPHIEIVMTPIEWHPGTLPPILDISYPHEYASEMCEEVGLFETLGWATMTNPLKDDRLGEDGFVKQTNGVYDTVRELSLNQLEKRDWDFFFTMFAVTDRMQHMMFRMIDPKSPTYDPELAKKYADSIVDIYKRMDDFVGEVADHFVDEDTLLLVVSDHGFKSFRRGVNLNRWLVNEGYLVGTNLNVTQSVEGLTQKTVRFGDVEWDKTKAYSLGLGGIYINRKGRESLGIVEDKDYEKTCDEIAAKLRTLKDTDGTPVVKEVYKRSDLYHGDQLDRAPDLVVGFQEGYRVSWQTTLGGAPPDVIENNMQKWSGDHCSVDPSLVPGILVSNRRLAVDSAAIVDVAPTVCAFLGIAPDGNWDGKALIGQGR